MIKLKSKLEANNFGGIIIKKGLNVVSNDIYFNVLLKNKTYLNFEQRGYIENIAGESEAPPPQKIPDFTSMPYKDLKAYVIAHNIEVASMKKADILQVLGIKKRG